MAGAADKLGIPFLLQRVRFTDRFEEDVNHLLKSSLVLLVMLLDGITLKQSPRPFGPGHGKEISAFRIASIKALPKTSGCLK